MKSFLLFAFVLISSASFAQLTKGALLLDGAGSFTISRSTRESTVFDSESKDKSIYANINPSLGFFVSEDLLLGVGVRYDYQSYVSESIGNALTAKQTSKQNMVSLTAYARKFIQVKDKLYFTGTLNINGGTGLRKLTSQQTNLEKSTLEFDIYQINASITPGLTYFLSTRWAISTSIGQLYADYYTAKPKDDNSEKRSEFRGGVNFELNTFVFSVQYFLKNGAE